MSSPIPPGSAQFLETLQKLLDQGKFDKVRQGCRDLLAREPEHREAQRLLDEATRRKTMLAQGAGSSIRVEALNCPECHSPLKPRGDSQALVCSSCGSVIDLTKGVGAKCASVDLQANRPLGFLHLGREGSLFGKRVQIIGRIRYHCSMSEWDEEDGCYTRGTWVYDEWQLVTEDKGYMFIEEDAEGYRVFQKFIPTSPQLPDTRLDFITLEQTAGRMRVMERGSAYVRYFEGEFTWLPQEGDASQYVDLGSSNPLYAIEWRLIDGNPEAIEEVEFFRGRVLTRLELLEAFGLKDELVKERGKLKSDREYRIWGWSYFAVSVVLFIAALTSLGNGKRIFERSILLSDIPAEGRLVGPIDLRTKGGLYNLNLASSIPDNSSAWGAVELLDSEFAAINAVERDFWSETGYDDEGTWKETDLSTDHYFRLEQPGTYYARFFVEKETASSGTLTLRVYEGVLLARYYLLGAIFALGMAVALGKFKKLNPVYAVAGLFVLGYLLISKLPNSDDDDDD